MQSSSASEVRSTSGSSSEPEYSGPFLFERFNTILVETLRLY